MPSFTIGLHRPGFRVLGRVEAERHPPVERREGDDIPSLFRNDVDGEKVEFRFEIANTLASLADAASDSGLIVLPFGIELPSGFHLYAPALASAIHDEVVTLVVSIGLGYWQFKFGGAMQERGFGKFALRLRHGGTSSQKQKRRRPGRGCASDFYSIPSV